MAAHRQFGTTALLPTLITDTPDTMHAAIDAVAATVDREPGVVNHSRFAKTGAAFSLTSTISVAYSTASA